MSEPCVVVVTPTIMDGTVVRWYASLSAAEQGREFISASRNAVCKYRPDSEIPAGVMAAAQRAYEALRANPDADMKPLATHRHERVFGPLVEVPGG